MDISWIRVCVRILWNKQSVQLNVNVHNKTICINNQTFRKVLTYNQNAAPHFLIAYLVHFYKKLSYRWWTARRD